MSGIAGIAQSGEQAVVEEMLEKITHRGAAGKNIIEDKNATIGMVWPEPQAHLAEQMEDDNCVSDESESGHLASATIKEDDLVLKRDQIGDTPPYQGITRYRVICLGSELI